MSKIKTESITTLNNFGANNIDLSDDGSSEFNGAVQINGPVVADRVKSGSSNLYYEYKSYPLDHFIPVPTWATTIEIDFNDFRAPGKFTGANIIFANFVNTAPTAVISNLKCDYGQITTINSFGAANTGGANYGSAAGSPAPSVMFLFNNQTNGDYTYNGTIKFNKGLLKYNTGDTNIIYNISMNGIYSSSLAKGYVNYNGYMYGAGNDPDDVLSFIGFGRSSGYPFTGAFNVRFREDDPGTLVS